MQIDWNPQAQKIREFGWVSLVGFGLVGIVAMWGWKIPAIAYACFIVSPVCCVLCLISPSVGRYIFVGLSAVTYPIGWFISHILLSVLYFAVITPIGLLMRVMGKDPLQRVFDRQAATYWEARQQMATAESYYRQS